MTDKEKLEKAIEFIKKIEKINIPKYDIEDLVQYTGKCYECGSEDVTILLNGPTEVCDPRDIEELKDEAWHVLADLI